MRLFKEAFVKVYGSVEDGAVQKITGAADRPLDQIRRYKNERLPAVAVTVDLLTTGIDVPEICNLVSLRRVRSRLAANDLVARTANTGLAGQVIAGHHVEGFRELDSPLSWRHHHWWHTCAIILTVGNKDEGIGRVLGTFNLRVPRGDGLLKRLGSVVGLSVICVCLTMCAPAGMEMVGDAMIDIGEELRDGGGMTSDARAQDGCATNCTSGGALRMVTADTDPNQAFGGVLAIPRFNPSEVVVGPAFLTDVRDARGGGAIEFFLTTAATCGADDGTMVGYFADGEPWGHGMRLFVPAGSRLCAASTASAGSSTTAHYFNGFRPYE